MAIYLDGVKMDDSQEPYDMNDKGVVRRVCTDCATLQPCKWQTDPYAEEIQHNFAKYWICKPCYRQSELDI